MENPIVFYDGICQLCHGAVRFIVRHERGKTLHFCGLQSPAAKVYIPSTEHHPPESIVLYEEGKLYTASDAALRIARYLRWYIAWLWVFRWVYRPWRDAVYFWIARNRYRWFGKKDVCSIPDAHDIAARSLDAS